MINFWSYFDKIGPFGPKTHKKSPGRNRVKKIDFNLSFFYFHTVKAGTLKLLILRDGGQLSN